MLKGPFASFGVDHWSPITTVRCLYCITVSWLLLPHIFHANAACPCIINALRMFKGRLLISQKAQLHHLMILHLQTPNSNQNSSWFEIYPKRYAVNPCKSLLKLAVRVMSPNSTHPQSFLKTSKDTVFFLHLWIPLHVDGFGTSTLVSKRQTSMALALPLNLAAPSMNLNCRLTCVNVYLYMVCWSLNLEISLKCWTCGKYGGNASMMDSYMEQIAMSSGAAGRQHTHSFQPAPTPICMPMHSESVICPSPLSRNLTFTFGIERFTQWFIPEGAGNELLKECKHICPLHVFGTSALLFCFMMFHPISLHIWWMGLTNPKHTQVPFPQASLGVPHQNQDLKWDRSSKALKQAQQILGSWTHRLIHSPNCWIQYERDSGSLWVVLGCL